MTWWKFQSKAQKAKKEILHASEEIAKNQPESLLQCFIDYVNRTQSTNHLKMKVDIPQTGKLSVICQFYGEKEYQYSLSNTAPGKVQENPELLINALYRNKGLNHVNDELKRIVDEILKVHGLKKRIATEWNVRKDRVKTSTLTHSYAQLKMWEKELNDRYSEIQAYHPKVWFNSPHFAERLHYIYKEFQREQTEQPIKPSDPVEADLMAILGDEVLSPETKDKARDLLEQYKRQQVEEKVVKEKGREQEALLILSTIEQHYVKKGGTADGDSI